MIQVVLYYNPDGQVDVNSTGSLTLPRGTTAQRPSSAVNGMIRYNTDTDVFEGYDGQWITLNGVRDVDPKTHIFWQSKHRDRRRYIIFLCWWAISCRCKTQHVVSTN